MSGISMASVLLVLLLPLENETSYFLKAIRYGTMIGTRKDSTRHTKQFENLFIDTST